jgi:predicted O-methyltransferase YrrM
MLFNLKKIIKKIVGKEKSDLRISWIQKKENSWLVGFLNNEKVNPSKNRFTKTIETLADKTHALGPQPLWDGYIKGDPNNKRDTSRTPNQVRTTSIMGNLYAEIVTQRKPNLIVEFGTAFGVSGMYFLSGLELNKKGNLLTYDPNEVWADLANKNLSSISDRYILTIGTFEENIDKHLTDNKKIDIAFIDAIHTSQFVFSQLEIVIQRCNPNAIIILDDINFSEDMKSCWEKIAHDERFVSSVSIGDRVGIVELSA